MAQIRSDRQCQITNDSKRPVMVFRAKTGTAESKREATIRLTPTHWKNRSKRAILITDRFATFGATQNLVFAQ